MVTRVESPPDEQQLLLQISAPAAPSQAEEASKKPVDVNTPTTQQTQPPPSSQTPTQTQLTQEDVKESSPALSTDCKLTEQSPVAHLESAVDTTQTHTLEPQSTSQPTHVTASTLDPEVTDSALSDSSSVQAVAFQLAESTKIPQPEPTCVEGKKEGEREEGLIEDEGLVMSPDSTEGKFKQLDELSQSQTRIPEVETQKQPLTFAFEQLQNELASASEVSQSKNQTEEEEEGGEEEEEEEEPIPLQEKQKEPANLSENEKPSLTENVFSQPSQEEPCPKQQTEADELGIKPILSVQTDHQAPSVTQGGAQESNLPAGEASKSPEPATTVSVSPVKVEDSPDESSADEGECFAEAPEEEVIGSALPNGLKPEFSLHLLDAESPKPGSCVMEHGESLLSLIYK